MRVYTDRRWSNENHAVCIQENHQSTLGNNPKVHRPFPTPSCHARTELGPKPLTRQSSSGPVIFTRNSYGRLVERAI